MNVYLAIITTAILVTQIIRNIQNAIQLRRQNIIFQEQMKSISEITESDLVMQKETNKMFYKYLKDRVDLSNDVED